MSFATMNTNQILMRAMSLHQAGQLQHAEVLYRQILQFNPVHADAMHLLGLLTASSGNLDGAVNLIESAIRVSPSHAPFHLNLGNLYHELRDYDAALACFDRALKLDQKLSDAYYNRGNTQQTMGRYEEAIASYDLAIRCKSDCADYYYNRANVLQILNKFQDAVVGYDKALSVQSNHVGALFNQGNALQSLKKFDLAVASYVKAIQLKPGCADFYNNLGNALRGLNRLDEAVLAYSQAAQLNPEYAEACHNRGIVLQAMARHEEAVVSLEMARRIKPSYDYISGVILFGKMKLCDWAGYDEAIATLEEQILQGRKVASPFTVTVLMDSSRLQKKAAETYANDKYPLNSSLGAIPVRSPSERIKVGYYSADFHNHATTWLIAELFERHDRSRFELFAFSFGPDRQDEMRRRITDAFDHFIDVRNQSDEEVARLSRSLSIDIAVDLKGFTHDERMGVFSYRAAPVQVSYLGYPGTTGTEYIDYLIADRILVPEASQSGYSEKIVYLPDSYQVNDRKRVIAQRQFTRAEVGLPEQGFVFCCFNNSYKITPKVFDSWVRILNAIPMSVLWLYEDNPTAVHNLRQQAVIRGLDPSRLVFAQKMELPEHLARHRLADLFLDSLPCNAHTTASDALWAGLPVLTCKGESFASRVAASLLTAMHLPDLITETVEQYEGLAIKLASHPEQLQHIKVKLKQNRLTTSLFDTERYTKNLESAFIQMVDQCQ